MLPTWRNIPPSDTFSDNQYTVGSFTPTCNRAFSFHDQIHDQIHDQFHDQIHDQINAQIYA